MKQILIACDSFKDALGAVEVCEAIQKGVNFAQADWTCNLLPLADGGEGTAEILTYHAEGNWLTIDSVDPLFRPISASFGLSKDGTTAFIDMAVCSGLQLLSQEERNPLLASTYGTGILLKDAIERGIQKIILGIGGSATNDAGIGMARALGYQFLDEAGNELEGRGKDLHQIRRIIPSTLPMPEIEVLCDVNNPLFGPLGAAHIYGPQKGASPEMVESLDQGLQHIASLHQTQTGNNWSDLPGSGAAGGMGFAAKAFLGAELRSGIDTVMEYAGFSDHLPHTDLIITGEGKIDQQTIHGKLIAGLCKQAAQAHVPVIGLCGALLATPQEVKQIGLQAAFSILNRPMALSEALTDTATLLEHTAANLGGMLNLTALFGSNK